MRNPSRVSSGAEASTGAEASSSTPKIRLGNLVVSTLYVTLVPCMPEASVEGSALEADYSQNWRHPTLNSGRTGADGLGILRRTTHNCDSNHSPCCTPFGISKQCQMWGQNRI